MILIIAQCGSIHYTGGMSPLPSPTIFKARLKGLFELSIYSSPLCLLEIVVVFPGRKSRFFSV